MLKVVKKSKGKFLVFDKQYLGTEVHLNFNPFLNFPDVKKGLLIHLRARPFHNPDDWSYGVYVIESDQYFSIEAFSAKSEAKTLQVSGEQRPTHVLFFPNSQIKIELGEGIIYEHEYEHEEVKLNGQKIKTSK